MGLSHPKAEPLKSEGAARGHNHEWEGAKAGPGSAVMTLGEIRELVPLLDSSYWMGSRKLLPIHMVDLKLQIKNTGHSCRKSEQKDPKIIQFNFFIFKMRPWSKWLISECNKALFISLSQQFHKWLPLPFKDVKTLPKSQTCIQLLFNELLKHL